MRPRLKSIKKLRTIASHSPMPTKAPTLSTWITCKTTKSIKFPVQMPAKLVLDSTVLRELANVLGISDALTRIWICTTRGECPGRLVIKIKAKVAWRSTARQLQRRCFTWTKAVLTRQTNKIKLREQEGVLCEICPTIWSRASKDQRITRNSCLLKDYRCCPQDKREKRLNKTCKP